MSTNADTELLAGGSRFMPIVRRHGLFLFCMDGDGKRFTERFLRVWQELPLSIRRKLLKHWRLARRQMPSEGNSYCPQIELLAWKSDFTRGNSENALAQTKTTADSFAFAAKSMDSLPDAAVEAVIAHELAHAVLLIGNRDEHLAGWAYDDWGFSPSEYYADELAECWGFDIPLLHSLMETAEPVPQVAGKQDAQGELQ